MLNAAKQLDPGRLGLVSGRGVLLKDGRASVSDSLQVFLQIVSQSFFTERRGYLQALEEDKPGHGTLSAGVEPTDDKGGGQLGMHQNGDLFDVSADLLVPLLVTLLVLVEGNFIREKPEHSSGPVLGLIDQVGFFGISRFLRGLCDVHAVRLVEGGVTNILLDSREDHQLAAAHLSDDLGIASAPITVNSLLDPSNEPFNPEG